MSNTHRPKRTFSPEFKLEAIEQIVKYQRDVHEVAQALELHPDHLRKWVRLYQQERQGIPLPAMRSRLSSVRFSSSRRR